MLTWSEKLDLLMVKGVPWKDVQAMDKGLEQEKNNPKDEPKDDPKDEPKDDPKDEPKDEPTENEKKLLEKIVELETQLKDAQSDNVHGNNETSTNVSFDEQLIEMFKDIRI